MSSITRRAFSCANRYEKYYNTSKDVVLLFNKHESINSVTINVKNKPFAVKNKNKPFAVKTFDKQSCFNKLEPKIVNSFVYCNCNQCIIQTYESTKNKSPITETKKKTPNTERKKALNTEKKKTLKTETKKKHNSEKRYRRLLSWCYNYLYKVIMTHLTSNYSDVLFSAMENFFNMF